METRELRGCSEDELIEICKEICLKRFRASQLFQWVQQKAVRTWEEMKNIGGRDQHTLRSRLSFYPLEKVREQRSKDGTRKYLFRLNDGETIECVLMDYARTSSRDRHTVCVSTQVGCAVGCAFCATGLEGFRRNLTVAEIVGQVLDITYYVRREDSDFQVTNIVFMGMGEPLLNYDQVLQAILLLNHRQGQNIGMRRMTISTCGVVPRIIQLAKDNPQVGLAVSLHTAQDEVRNDLIPINRRYPLGRLMAACREYTQITHRRITFEVALTTENAKQEEAEALARLLKGQFGHVNLIPVNPVAGTGMERPNPELMRRFARVLEDAGISVSSREERGADIDAACGQLRRQWKGEL
jgi:23S rRNA (adenine2503-C2)-methyltransferase